MAKQDVGDAWIEACQGGALHLALLNRRRLHREDLCDGPSDRRQASSGIKLPTYPPGPTPPV